MRTVPALAPALVFISFFACDDPGASLHVRDARSDRDAERHVIVDVDLEAHEQLGGSIGTYCVRVTFTAEDPRYHEECKADLEDGDTKTARFVSDNTDLPEGSPIKVRVRLGAVDIGRDLAAPK